MGGGELQTNAQECYQGAPKPYPKWFLLFHGGMTSPFPNKMAQKVYSKEAARKRQEHLPKPGPTLGSSSS